MTNPATISIQQLCTALLDASSRLNPRFLYRFSDLEPAEIEHLQQIWSQVPLWRRQALMEDIEELSSNDTLLDFVALCRLAVEDSDAKVRLLAIETLEDYEDKALTPLLIRLLRADPDAEVRAAAASGLSKYVYAGELEEIPAALLREIEETLLQVTTGADQAAVRRAALESLGYSSRDEVAPLIESAYQAQEKEWVASALFAMGRSANQAWQAQVLQKLDSPLPLVRSEAARAAGELELTEALPRLLDLLDDPDDNTRSASIWSLSQIGGEGVRAALETLFAETEDEDEAEFIEAALDNLAFSEGRDALSLFDLPDLDEDKDEDELEDYLDLEELEELLDEEDDED